MTSPWNHQHTFKINSETVVEGIKESLKSLEALEGKSFTGHITVTVAGQDEYDIEMLNPYTPPKILSEELVEPLDTVLKMVASGIPLKWVVRNVLSGYTPQQIRELLDELDAKGNPHHTFLPSIDPNQVEKILLDQIRISENLHKGLWIEGTYIEGFSDPDF